MPFTIETRDQPGHAQLRRQVRNVHLAYLEANKSMLPACGAKPQHDRDNAGSGLYVVDLDTRKDVECFIAKDLFALAGLFAHVTITR